MKLMRLGLFWPILLIFILSAVPLLALQSRPTYAQEPLKIGLNVWPGYGAFFIADDKAFFKNEGVDVQLSIIDGDPEREASLASGRLDAIGMTLDNLVLLRSRGIDARAVYKYDGSNGADGIVVRREYKSLNDLRGKKVGWASGTTSNFFLAVALARVGLHTTDLEHVSLSSDDAGAAFAAGHLDAAVTWEPWLSKAKESGLGYTLISSRELPVIEDVLFFNADILTTRRQEVRGFLRACFEAVSYWKSHPDEAVQIISKHLGMPPADVKSMLGGIKVMDYSDLEFGHFRSRRGYRPKISATNAAGSVCC